MIIFKYEYQKDVIKAFYQTLTKEILAARSIFWILGFQGSKLIKNANSIIF